MHLAALASLMGLERPRTEVMDGRTGGPLRPAVLGMPVQIPTVARDVDTTGGQALDQERVYQLLRRFTVSALALFAAFTAVACGVSQPAVSRSAPLPEPAPPPDVAVQSAARDPEVGSSVGSRTPDFEMRLADGTLVTFASLNAESRPAFLFFFATW